jgi:hypothetical protein
MPLPLTVLAVPKRSTETDGFSRWRRVAGAKALMLNAFRPARLKPCPDTPLLNPGFSDFPHYIAGQTVTTVVSPDHETLLVLTSGYNQLYNSAGNAIAADSIQFVFVYDISKG